MKKRWLIWVVVTMLAVLAAGLVGCKGLFGGLFGESDSWDGKQVSLSKDHFYSTPHTGALAYSYTGEPITVERDVIIYTPDKSKRVDNSLFEFTYTNNVNVGKAKVKITAKAENEYYFGSVEFEYDIAKGAVIVTTAEELVKELKGDNVYRITVNGNFELQEELTVKEGVTLTINPASSGERHVKVGAKLTNNGTIELGGTPYYYGSVNFYINDRLINNGSITVGEQAYFYNAGTVQNNGSMKTTASRYSIYTNGGEIENFLDMNGNAAKQTVRHQVAAENIQLHREYVVYSENHNYNQITFDFVVDGKSRFVMYSKEYREYDHAGTGYIDITIGPTDEYFYGTLTLPYEIQKASTTVRTVAELKEYASTGNYGTFTAVDFTVEEGESLTLAEDAVFYTSRLYVSGTLINNGTIYVQSTSSASVLPGYFYVNYDTSGTGHFENNGTVSARSFSVLKNGSAINRGTITAGWVSLQDHFTNEAGAQLTATSDSYLYGRLVNKGTIEMTAQTYLTVGQRDSTMEGIDNSGSMRIEGDIVCRSLDEFNNSGTFVNTGTVYSYIALPTDFVNVVVKRQLVKEDIVIEGGMPTYDGTAKPVTFAQDTGLTAGQVYIEYIYEDAQPTTTAPVNAGKMTLLIRVKDERTKYFAAVNATDERGILRDVPYEILHAERGVSTAQDLYDYGNNENYARLYLENDIVFSSAKTEIAKQTTYSFRVAKGVVLDTNGHILSLEFVVGGRDPYVSNYGTILNSKLKSYPVNFEPTLADCGLVFKKASLYNYGTLVNNNLVHFDRNSSLVEQEGSKIENHGIMYLAGLLSERTELINDGKIYEREKIDDLYKDRTRVDLEYWVADYNAQEHCPEVYLYDRGGRLVDTQDSSRFEISAFNDVTLRLCTVYLTALDNFDKEFCGGCALSINIVKSVAKVADINALDTATKDSNYIGYELVESFKLNKNITIPAGTFLDLGNYDFSQLFDYQVDMTSGAELRVSVDTMDKFKKYIYVADKITFVGDISDEGLTSITFNASVMGKISGYTPFNKLYESVTIDLNGHSMGGQLSILNQYNPHINTTRYFVMNIVDTSEGKTGRLGRAGTKHALSVGAPTAMYLNLTDVTIGGLELYYTVYCTAKNSTFETESISGNTRAAYYCGQNSNNNVQAVFEKCTFKGAVGAYVTCAKHIFRDCSITANGSSGTTGNWYSAILINDNYAKVGIDGGNLTSINGYCVEINNMYEVNRASIEITKRSNINSDAGSDESGRWSCGQGMKVNNATYIIVDALSGFGMIV